MLHRVFALREGETAPVLLSTLLFWLLLTAYYLLRPLREEMGLAGGVDNLPGLFMITLAAMVLVAPLLGWLVRRYRREVFLPAALHFFAANLVLFYVALRFTSGDELVVVGRVFYVWLSVFNLCVLSLFWAFMVDGFGYERSRRLFGIVALGGTAGAIVGSGLTTLLVSAVGRHNLVLAALVLLEAAVACILVLSRRFYAAGYEPTAHEAPGGGILAGVTRTVKSPYLLGISAYIFLYSLTATFLYFEQARIIAANVVGRDARTAMFGQIDLWTNVLTLGCQLFLTGRLLRVLGAGLVLAMLPLAVGLGFAALGAWPTLTVLVIFQVARRAGNYALAKPARETLFTVLDREDRYKAKNFIDTFVYRGGDALGAGIFARITATGLVSVAWLAVPVAAVWLVVALALGRRQRTLARRRAADGGTGPATVS
ncbi:MAG: NTP/NDP exchange transporter [Candidatus Krumholzibacteriia bacterium]